MIRRLLPLLSVLAFVLVLSPSAFAASRGRAARPLLVSLNGRIVESGTGAPGFNVTGSGMTCRACAAPVNPASIGLTGRCNPLPLRAVVKGASVTVAASELAKWRALFEVK